MGVNKAKLGLHNKVVKDLSTVKRNIRELKTPQQVGVDIIQVQSIPSDGSPDFVGPLELGPGSGSSGTLNAQSGGVFQISNLPELDVPTLWNFAFTVYVDPTITLGPAPDYVETPDSTNQWPFGSSLSLGQLNIVVSGWEDWANSDFANNNPSYYIYIQNNDTHPHFYWVEFVAFLPSTGNDL